MIFIVTVAFALSQPSHAGTLHSPLPTRGAIQLFATPDDSSTVVAILKPGEEIFPLAETLAGEGVRWYLVKDSNNRAGWVKRNHTDESKQLERFFKSLPAEPSLPLADVVSPPSSGGFLENKITVPVFMNGASVIVPVTFNGALRGNLALDTGATITVVSRRIANSLTLKTLGTGKIGTVGGVITAPLARLQSLKVGDAEVHDLVVSIHDFSTDPRIQGLLGLDFLKHFHVALDTRRGVLTFGPR